jgi:hypothetical protein
LDWRWTARRWVVSAFLIFQVAATAIWVLPACPIRDRVAPTLQYYMVPSGLWQFWSMFAPDPQHDVITLEAEVIDRRGLRNRFAFTRVGDYNAWAGIPKFRHAKFAANISIKDEDFEHLRRFTARYVVRTMKVPAEAFPLDVHLFYQVKETPAPGAPPADGMAPTKPLLIATYAFANPSEVWP